MLAASTHLFSKESSKSNRYCTYVPAYHEFNALSFYTIVFIDIGFLLWLTWIITIKTFTIMAGRQTCFSCVLYYVGSIKCIAGWYTVVLLFVAGHLSESKRNFMPAGRERVWRGCVRRNMVNLYYKCLKGGRQRHWIGFTPTGSRNIVTSTAPATTSIHNIINTRVGREP